MRKTMILGFALIWVAQLCWAEVNSSQPLKIYYASANGTSDDALRLALYDVIKDHTQIGYKQLGPIMQWSDTENADGVHIVDIYTNCPYTVSGPVSFGNASSVGGGMNREHTVPQSWFGEAEPMRSDVFHVYPTDCKANNNRSSYLFGECANGSSSSTSKCKETGKLGSSDWSVFSGTVYEVVDEYKGDIARSYFYMATRYANVCASWGGGAFGSMNNGLGAYTAELMLKWHQQDPVSEKELIRNEVIYGNPLYNKSSSKQGNRNPFIDYPELVDYIWGSKKNVPVTIDLLESPYANESPATDVEYVLSNEPVAHKVLINGQIYIVVDEQLYNLQGQRVK